MRSRQSRTSPVRPGATVERDLLIWIEQLVDLADHLRLVVEVLGAQATLSQVLGERRCQVRTLQREIDDRLQEAELVAGVVAHAVDAAGVDRARLEQLAQPVADAATTPPPVSEGGCDDVQAQWLVGKPATDADVEQARKDAKATLVRQLKPGQAVTLEFNESRLNVELDAKGVVTAVRCG